MFQNLPETKATPRVTFIDGVLTLEGNSIPEDSMPFYNPIINSLREYALSTQEKIVIEVKIGYFNSSSMRSMMGILDVADELFKNGHRIKVNWYYINKDDVAFDAGTIFISILSIPITLIAKETSDSAQ